MNRTVCRANLEQNSLETGRITQLNGLETKKILKQELYLNSTMVIYIRSISLVLLSKTLMRDQYKQKQSTLIYLRIIRVRSRMCRPRPKNVKKMRTVVVRQSKCSQLMGLIHSVKGLLFTNKARMRQQWCMRVNYKLAGNRVQAKHCNNSFRCANLPTILSFLSINQ